MRSLVPAVATLLLAAACSSPATDTAADQPGTAPAVTTPAAQPQTADGAKAAAELVFSRFGGGDYAGAWDLYTAAGKAAIKREDYVAFQEECHTPGVVVEAADARLEDAVTAVVTGKALGFAQSYEMRYEGGRWLLQPEADTMKSFAGGAESAIAARRADGGCQAAAPPTVGQ